MEYYEDAVTVGELFEEELFNLEQQHAKLIEENTHESRLTAKKIEHVIEYFKLRLELLDYDINEAYGVDIKQTLH